MKEIKIPTPEGEWEFDTATVQCEGGEIFVDFEGVHNRTVLLSPGGAVLLAEQLLKAARKAA
jgi:hypothetical protein